MGKNNSTTTQKSWVSSPICQKPRNEFPSLEKIGKMQKNVREAPSLLTVAKMAFSNPKIVVPFFPFTQQHRKWIMGMEKWRNNIKSWGKERSVTFLLCERDQTPWRWVRNESHGCIMAWACLPKLLLAPQVKNTLSENGWSSQSKIDLHTFPIPRK